MTTTLEKKPEKKEASHVKEPKITYNKQPNTVSGFSLSSVSLKKSIKKKEVVELDPNELPKDTFTGKELDEFWKNYALDKIKKGENNIASILQMNSPQLKEQFTIHFEVANQLNKVELSREMEYLLPALKKHFNNYSILHKIHIAKTVKVEMAYSPKEKYDQLLKINPELDRLRKTFDLEF